MGCSSLAIRFRAIKSFCGSALPPARVAQTSSCCRCFSRRRAASTGMAAKTGSPGEANTSVENCSCCEHSRRGIPVEEASVLLCSSIEGGSGVR